MLAFALMMRAPIRTIRQKATTQHVNTWCRLGELPGAVGGLSRLQTLSLASCGLGQLPEAIGCLQQLVTLDVSLNSLRELPASLGKRPGPAHACGYYSWAQ